MLKNLKQIFAALILFFLTGSLVSAAGYQFNRNLYVGLSSDSDVVQLQNMLRKLGFFTLPTSTGNYFGLTADAVKKFQIANNITPVSGYFGPKTRFEANRLSGAISTDLPIYAPIDRSPTSTYYGRIRINNARNANNTTDEYITLQNTSTTSISINGFNLVNSDNEEFKIPLGHNLPGVRPVAGDKITLNQYDKAEIYTGQQEKHLDFRENICTGYLDQHSDFFDKLSHNCPRPDISSNLRLPDHCIQVFEQNRSCQTDDTSQIQVAECLDYSEAHYNYQGCVRDFQNRSDFFSNNWLIWMQRSTKFLRDIHDKVTLYDGNGKIVDIYTY